ncbi:MULTISPECIES: dihydropteroate synthase [Prochlorococcus]|uniref:dihydropteroate synthase n=1 Tax=Prochlorococcus TaxID=1218 RepID=UPI000533917F|nr:MULTISPECIES: dihydropteroate synthase [Prochlorococcus]KGG12408.1 Dihydropteroate synthase [Prochlorococcus sp. MIT 0601]
MAVINLTPDSFSDGGSYQTIDLAIKKIESCIEDGADVLDLGAQSTRPGAKIIESQEELDRLIPTLKTIRARFPELIISVDTFYSKVAQKAIDLGANWINDISGGRIDPIILEIVANASCPFIITHSRGNSQTMNNLAYYKNVCNEVCDELNKRTVIAIDKGIKEANIIWDPGIGFAKDTEHNLQLLSNLEFFTKKKYPLMVGPSRKRFIGDVINQPNPLLRSQGTSAVICRCVQAKTDIVRVHDVKETKETIVMSSKLWT